MIQFNELRKKMPPGEHVMDKKIDGIQVMVHKHQGKFVAYVDGDKLDSYRTQREAEKAAAQFVKQFRKMK
jgi:hypothetical protein